jgi:hypothetical protein
MNDAQRNIINLMMSYGEWHWSQPGDWGDDVVIYRDKAIESNHEEIMRVVSKSSCVVVESYDGNNMFPNELEAFSFECRYPTHHYVHYAMRCWHTEDGDEVPFQTGEINEIARAFARAFELPLRYINGEESK